MRITLNLPAALLKDIDYFAQGYGCSRTKAAVLMLKEMVSKYPSIGTVGGEVRDRHERERRQPMYDKEVIGDKEYERWKKTGKHMRRAESILSGGRKRYMPDAKTERQFLRGFIHHLSGTTPTEEQRVNFQRWVVTIKDDVLLFAILHYITQNHKKHGVLGWVLKSKALRDYVMNKMLDRKGEPEGEIAKMRRGKKKIPLYGVRAK